MSEEQKTEISQAEQNDTGKTVTLGKSNRKKWGIIGGIAVVLVALIIGISIYNTPANRLSRQLDLGNRYLEEQNYEQAIVEFDKAIAIDPMSVDAYLGKAEAYIGLGDLQSAHDTLLTGYELTGDERLKAKIDEIQVQSSQTNQSGEVVQPVGEVEEAEVQEGQDYIELPFSFSDIKIKGYDLLEPHAEEVAAAFGCPVGTDDDYANTQYGSMHIYHAYDDTAHSKTFEYSDTINDNGGYLTYSCDKNHNGLYSIYLKLVDYYGDGSFFDNIQAVSGMPVEIGDSYEECYKKLGGDIIQDASDSSDISGTWNSWGLLGGFLYDNATGETMDINSLHYIEMVFSEENMGTDGQIDCVELQVEAIYDNGDWRFWSVRVYLEDEIVRNIDIVMSHERD